MSRAGVIGLSTLVVLPAFAALLGLGTWQVQRLLWKSVLIEAREAALAEEPRALPAQDRFVERMAFRRVTATGTFIHGQELYLYAPQSGKNGYRVLTPLQQDVGVVVLIDRGWVPADRRDPATRPEGQIQGEVTITGIVRNDIVGVQGPLPDNEPENNQWYWVDTAAMSAANNTYYRPALVSADGAPNPGGWPLGDAEPPRLRNPHLGYAITWYALALALSVIYVMALRRQLAGREKKPAPDWDDI